MNTEIIAEKKQAAPKRTPAAKKAPVSKKADEFESEPVSESAADTKKNPAPKKTAASKKAVSSDTDTPPEKTAASKKTTGTKKSATASASKKSTAAATKKTSASEKKAVAVKEPPPADEDAEDSNTPLVNELDEPVETDNFDLSFDYDENDSDNDNDPAEDNQKITHIHTDYDETEETVSAPRVRNKPPATNNKPYRVPEKSEIKKHTSTNISSSPIKDKPPVTENKPYRSKDEDFNGDLYNPKDEAFNTDEEAFNTGEEAFNADEEAFSTKKTFNVRDKSFPKKNKPSEKITKLKFLRPKEKKGKIKPKKKVSLEKTDIYVLRKNTAMKVLRVILWVFLIFIFIKGVIVSVRPDPVSGINKSISDFYVRLNDYSARDYEILAFAQNFTREYLTYEARGEKDYTERLRAYASPSVVNALHKLSGSSEAIYAHAYKKTAYSDTQADVYVTAQVGYAEKKISEDGTEKEQISVYDAILKVPVFIRDGKYIVEDLPAFVNDDMKISDYTQTRFSASEVGREETEAIRQALSNFFKSYYEDEQSVINYYLAKEADKSSFMGLNKRVLFNKLEEINCFTEAGSEGITALVTVSVTDKNSVVMPQRFNLGLIYKDNRYYVASMDTRISNLNIISQEVGDE